MIDIKDKKDCCGCNACGDICPKDAINFQTDNEGFWYPVVDEDKCIHCNICDKICPIINIDSLKKNDFEQSECYACENKNLEVIFDSTSGGLFSAFADKMYREHGYVGGAVFAEDFKSVKHYISADKKDLKALRSSKYLQSDLHGFFRQVKKLLDAGEKVLVCGCPCQMTGLRSFLRKDYKNLLILDFICLGINSPLIWRKYLATFEERYGSPAVYAKAKSKEYGWRNLTQKIKLANGQTLFETKDVSNYTRGYIGTHAYMRPSCYDCKFRGYPRISDITLADLWGIEKYSSELEKNLGTSLVMVNSQKGREWFDKIQGRLNFLPIPFKDATQGNPALVENPSRPSINREEFFDDVNTLSFVQVAEKYKFSPNAKGKPTNVQVFKSSLRRFLRLTKRTFKGLRHLNSSLRTIRHNSIKSIVRNRYISFAPYSHGEISSKAKIGLCGLFRVGWGRYRNSKVETRILIDDNAKLTVNGNVLLGQGSDVEIFSTGHLIIKGNLSTNVNLTLICADKIEIGKDVIIGRGVTIRDNNGGHYINRGGYKDSRPIIIGNKVWLCEGCTIMPGVRIGDGAIIGAKAFVTSNVPANTLVSGNPAKIVDEDVLWKY